METSPSYRTFTRLFVQVLSNWFYLSSNIRPAFVLFIFLYSPSFYFYTNHSLINKYNDSLLFAVAVKEGCPSDYELQKLSKEITGVWMKLGRQLNFRASKLTGFHKDHDELREKAYAMLLEWKNARGSDATYQVLYEGLCDKLVNRKDLAEKVCCQV